MANPKICMIVGWLDVRHEDRICRYSLSSSVSGGDSEREPAELDMLRIWSRRAAGEKFSSSTYLITVEKTDLDE